MRVSAVSNRQAFLFLLSAIFLAVSSYNNPNDKYIPSQYVKFGNSVGGADHMTKQSGVTGNTGLPTNYIVGKVALGMFITGIVAILIVNIAFISRLCCACNCKIEISRKSITNIEDLENVITRMLEAGK